MKRPVWLAFAALCLLSGSGWMVDQFSPPVLSGPVRVAVQDGVLALIFAGASRLKGRPSRLSLAQWIELALAGAALLAVPTIVGAGASGKVSSLDEILCYCLVPAVIVFLVGQSSVKFGAGENPLRLLVAALAGLGGAALILPFTLPAALAGKAWLLGIVASAIISACAALRLHRSLRIDITGAGLLQQCAILCATASAVAAIFYRVDLVPIGLVTTPALFVELLRMLFLTAPIILLLICLLREMSPVAISTRLLLIPLVTIVESYLIERPQTGWTTFAGALLMAAAAILLLRADEPGDTQHGFDPPL